MDDTQIIQLYWSRDERAIPATVEKYGAYCTKIAESIVGNREDAEECVNDTFLNAWYAMPPHKPSVLSTFLGKITRNIAFNKHKYRTADKRGGGEMELILDELAECVSGKESVEQELEKNDLVRTINSFLDTLSQEKCDIFLCRYWYAMPVSVIANRFGMTEGNASVTISRIRSKLKEYLIERGYDL